MITKIDSMNNPDAGWFAVNTYVKLWYIDDDNGIGFYVAEQILWTEGITHNQIFRLLSPKF